MLLSINPLFPLLMSIEGPILKLQPRFFFSTTDVLLKTYVKIGLYRKGVNFMGDLEIKESAGGSLHAEKVHASKYYS